MDLVTVQIAIIAVLLAVFTIVIVGKRKESGYKANAKDTDKDGIVQEGTVWERPAATVRIVPAKKKAPVKKTAAKKAAPAKKAPAKKAAPKKK
jgi:hypothetical protein